MNTDHLARAALAAGGTHQNMLAEHAIERSSQADALVALIEAVKPALNALVTPLSIDFGDVLTDPEGENARGIRGHFYRLGPPLRGDAGALYLDAVGQLWWANYTAKRWEVVAPGVAARAAVWPVEAWVGQLAMSCEAITNGRAGRTAAAARQRAQRLRALAVLLDITK